MDGMYAWRNGCGLHSGRALPVAPTQLTRPAARPACNPSPCTCSRRSLSWGRWAAGRRVSSTRRLRSRRVRAEDAKGAAARTEQVRHLAALVEEHLRPLPRRYGDGLAGAQLDLRAVRRRGRHVPGEAVLCDEHSATFGHSADNKNRCASHLRKCVRRDRGVDASVGRVRLIDVICISHSDLCVRKIGTGSGQAGIITYRSGGSGRPCPCTSRGPPVRPLL